jgi:hypothetical protein
MPSDLTAYTLSVDLNSTYLSQTSTLPATRHINDPTLGLMMLLSTLQYESPYMNQTYSNAANQAGKAAYVESGGQGLQNNFLQRLGKETTDAGHQMGLTDTEMGILFETAKTAKTHKLDINGPKVYFMKTRLTIEESRGSVGVGWSW